jgi:hypothetical protein
VIRTIDQILGPATTLIGVLLSIWGTYLLTHWYHPFEFLDFLKSVLQVTTMYMFGRRDRAMKIVRAATKFGGLNEEKRYESLVGLCFIFVGFVLQAVGALCWGVDTIWGLMEKAPCP